jgi:putative N-acetylmannosamine-6-phosphate epimerase
MITDAKATLKSAMADCGLVAEGDVFAREAWLCVQTTMRGQNAEASYNHAKNWFRLRLKFGVTTGTKPKRVYALALKEMQRKETKS